MSTQPVQDPAPASTPTHHPDDSSWAALGRGLLEEMAGVARERLRLFALEGQQFALAAGYMLALGVIAAVFVLTAWFVLIGGIFAGIVQLGVRWEAAVAGGVLINLLAALFAWLAMRRLLKLMMFPATLRRTRMTMTATAAPTPQTEQPVAPARAPESAAIAAQPASGSDRPLQATP